ncbi:MAG: hypothetical protein GX442_15440 [Candidatus Riflebacteria bacterium]|nr:hypothetical protein [Candidatus Riflebacteria bacterium]
MRKPTLVALVVVLFFGATSLLSARPGDDPNAAVRYLLAIGHLPAVSDKVLDDLGQLETFADLAKVSQEGAAFLRNEKFATAMRLLQLGAACPQCNFTPDDTWSLEDPVPPYRRIRQLARLARIYAWDREKAGKPDEAFALLTSVFMLGQHLEDQGLLISVMIGVACRKIAVNALIEFRTRHPEPQWRQKLVTFFQRVPKPAVNIRASLEYERKGMANILKQAKTDHRLFGLMEIPVPENAKGAKAPPAPAPAPAPDKECRAGQRVLLGALEMLAMDYTMPLPATISADLPAALLQLGYLRKPVTCPSGGELKISLNDKGEPAVECLLHGTIDTPSASAAQDAEKAREAAVAWFGKLADTPEYDRLVAECLKFYDDLLAIDLASPTGPATHDALWKKIEAADNPFASAVIPNHRKAWEEGIKLEELIRQVQQ